MSNDSNTKIEELPGVGPATADKLREAGYADLMAIAVASPKVLAEHADLGTSSAEKIIAAARKLADVGSFVTGDQILTERSSVRKLHTGAPSLDDLLGGGIESRAITEFFGAFGCGKCVAKDTPVLYYVHGVPHFRTLEELWSAYAEPSGTTPYDDGELISDLPIEVVGITDEGLAPTRATSVYREYASAITVVRTLAGRRLRTTSNHRFLSVDVTEGVRWLPAGLLQPGMPVATPRTLQDGAESLLSPEDAFFLGVSLAGASLDPPLLRLRDTTLAGWVEDHLSRRHNLRLFLREDHRRLGVTYHFRLPDAFGPVFEALPQALRGECRLPEEVIGGTEAIAAHFVAGYLRACGGPTATGLLPALPSAAASQLAYLLARLGVQVSGGESSADGEVRLRLQGDLHQMATSLPSLVAGDLVPPRGARSQALPSAVRELIEETFRDCAGRRLQIDGSLTSAALQRVMVDSLQLLRTIDDLFERAQGLLELDREGFRALVRALPFPFIPLASGLGLSEARLRNWLTRGLPVDAAVTMPLQVAILEELSRRRTRTRWLLSQLKNLHSLAWDEVTSVTEEPYDDFVYDVVVPQNHAFVGGALPTVLHNTQICHQAAINVQLPPEEGGAGGHAVMIDTEGTFRPERIIQMAEALDLDPTEVLRRIHVARAYNSHHQMLLVDKADELAHAVPVRLLIVDSLTSHFRAEFVGRGALAERQQNLNRHLSSLHRFSNLHDAAVVVSNQVMAKPDTFFGDPTSPIGGHIVGHSATFRIYLRKSKGEKRIARLIDSPNLPEGEAVFSVTLDGIRP